MYVETFLGEIVELNGREKIFLGVIMLEVEGRGGFLF